MTKEDNFSEELINELSRDMCFRKDSCTVNSRCFELNCETTWLAVALLRAGWVKQKEATRGLHLGNNYYCSNCGKLAAMDNYCSNCGAKVIKKETPYV
jgi:hypothetical protein